MLAFLGARRASPRPPRAADRRYSVTDFDRVIVEGPYLVRLVVGRASVGGGERHAATALDRVTRRRPGPDPAHPPQPLRLGRHARRRSRPGHDRARHPQPALGAADRPGPARRRGRAPGSTSNSRSRAAARSAPPASPPTISRSACSARAGSKSPAPRGALRGDFQGTGDVEASRLAAQQRDRHHHHVGHGRARP